MLHQVFGTIQVVSSLTNKIHILQYADVVELVDTLALGASASGREGSSPFIRTRGEFTEKPSLWAVFCMRVLLLTKQRGVHTNRGKISHVRSKFTEKPPL